MNNTYQNGLSYMKGFIPLRNLTLVCPYPFNVFFYIIEWPSIWGIQELQSVTTFSKLADMRASRAVLSSSVWEILATGRYWVQGGIIIYLVLHSNFVEKLQLQMCQYVEHINNLFVAYKSLLLSYQSIKVYKIKTEHPVYLNIWKNLFKIYTSYGQKTQFML